MIGQGLGRLAFAEKLSIPQLEEALENKTIPAYIGVPLLEEKVQMRQRMQAAQAGMTPPPQMTIEEEVFAKANQMKQAEMPDEGIATFAGGGEVIRAFNGLPDEMYQDDRPTMRGVFPAIGQTAQGIGTSVSNYFQGGFYNDIEQLARLGYTDLQISQMTPAQRAEVARQTRSAMSDSVAAPAAIPVAQQDPGIAPDVPQAPAEEPVVAPDPGIAPPETPAPRGASNLSIPELMGQTEQLYGALYGDQKPEAPAERGDYLTRAQEFLTQSGVDLDLASKQAQEVALQKAELEGDRREAKKFSVISAGLAILAGDPANSVAENIGKGLGKGMEQYTTAIKDLKKTEREMQALERSLAVAQNQARMGVATMAAGDYRDAQKRYDDLNKEMRTGKADLAKALLSDRRAREVVEAQMRSKPSTFSEQLDALVSGGMSKSDATKLILGATKTGILTPANIQTAWGRLSAVDKLNLRKLNPPVTNVEEYTEYRLQGGPERPSGPTSGPAAGGASNDPLGLRTP